jgi:hypothetical protein
MGRGISSVSFRAVTFFPREFFMAMCVGLDYQIIDQSRVQIRVVAASNFYPPSTAIQLSKLCGIRVVLSVYCAAHALA